MNQKVYCFDLDGTITVDAGGERRSLEDDLEYYSNVAPNERMITIIRSLYKDGNRIIISTARGMGTCGGNVDLIKQRLGSVTIDWLRKYDVLYHEINFGKSLASYYIDDKAINANDFKLKGY